jgi:hypothetical protein
MTVEIVEPPIRRTSEDTIQRQERAQFLRQVSQSSDDLNSTEALRRGQEWRRRSAPLPQTKLVVPRAPSLDTAIDEVEGESDDGSAAPLMAPRAPLAKMQNRCRRNSDALTKALVR